MKVKRNIIKELRVSRGWTQEHLAHLCGCSARTIARAEKDGVNSMETITALAAVFGVEASQLMGMIILIFIVPILKLRPQCRHNPKFHLVSF
ncbi:helix-turn-helix domain-containing protein [Legionella bozemanae]|uniref:helix-turn-helix domain-containing protein n=1 Tax=Legionella bozemanae TaxID=447 RepID=UPI003EF029AF